MVESSRAAAIRRPSGLMRMHSTSSDIFSVRTCRAERRFNAGVGACADGEAPATSAPAASPARISHSQNFTAWSALQLTKPLPSGTATTDHTCTLMVREDYKYAHVTIQPARTPLLPLMQLPSRCQ